MANELQKAETPIDQAIVRELIALTPETWNSMILEVTHSSDDNGTDVYNHVISSPEGHRDIVTASEAIFDATYRLGLLFRQHGRHWKTVTYRAQLLEDGSWDYKVNFTY